MNDKKNKTNQRIKGSFFEQMKDLGNTTAKTAFEEAGKIGSGVIRQTIGGNFSKPGNITEGQNINQPFSTEKFPLHKQELPMAKPRQVEIFSLAERKEEVNTKKEIQLLVAEIKREIILLQKKQKVMIEQAAKVTVENLPDKPGIYHIRFFEWLLKLLQDLRKKASESASWFSVLKNKKRQKGYWKMLKKHGTSFGLSNERSVATQVG